MINVSPALTGWQHKKSDERYEQANWSAHCVFLEADILPVAESLTAAHYRPAVPAADALVIKGAELLAWLPPRLPAGVSLAQEGDALVVRSELPAGVYANLYAEPRFDLAQLNLVNNKQIRLLVEHDLPEMLTVFEYQDTNKRKTGHTMNPVGATCTLLLPESCCYLRLALRLALRIQGTGVAHIRAFVFGEADEPTAVDLQGLVALSNLAQVQIKGVSKVSLVSRAKVALYVGDYAKAVELFTEAFTQQPKLANLYGFNLNLARSKICLPPVGTDFLQGPTP